jgi:hypothetical protein
MPAMVRRWRLTLVLALLSALAAPAVANADFMHFTTPSKNIDCVADFSAPSVDCLVQKASWARVPPKPAGCDLDWIGTEIALSRGRVSLGACRGDIGPLCVEQSGDCPALPYGTSLTLPSKVRYPSLRSARACVPCAGAGPGFTVSRGGYRIFR